MQGWYAASFEREMGCTEADLLRWLPGAVQPHGWVVRVGSAEVTIGSGRLDLHWSELSARRIALMQMPRLAVTFSFDGISEDERQRFMRYFDLYTQRGGG